MAIDAGTDACRATVFGLAPIGLVVGTSALTSSPVAIAFSLCVCVLFAALSPVGALGAVIATLPWFHQPVAFGEQRFAVSELLLVAAVAGTFLRLALRLRSKRFSYSEVGADVTRAGTRPIVLTLAMLTLTGLVLILYPYDAAHRSESLREWRWVFVEPFVLVVLLCICATARSSRAFLAVALIAGAVGASAQGVLDLVGAGGVAVEGVTRISGPFPHPNALALMTTRVAVLGIAWLAIERSTRRFLAGPALLTVLATLATFSRGAWASLTVGVLLSATFVDRRLRYVMFGAPITIILLATAVARDRMMSLFSGGSGSLRLSIWSSALEMIVDRPLRGYGPDQFLYAYLPRYVRPEAWNERFSSHAHNLIFDFWIRLGIIGCAFAIGVVIVCLIATVGLVRQPTHGEALPTAAIIALVAAVIHGLVDDAYFSHELAMSAWLLAWLAFQPVRAGAVEGAHDSASPRLRWRGVHRFASVRQSPRGRPRRHGR